jgi:colanic acid biosynthesis glycosyl transferase WcaI
MLLAALRWKPDVVFVVAPALVSAPIGLMAARLSGAKCWLHIQDFEVEAAFATGLVKENSLLGSAAVAFENVVHRRFDRVSSISEPMLRKLAAKGLPAERVIEFRNWANLDAVSPLEGESPLREAFGIETPHVALYSGSIGNKQGLEIIIEAARRLAHRKDLTFVICGDGPFLPELRGIAEGLNNIRFFPLQPMNRLGDLLGMASVHLLPQIAGVTDLVLPSKLTNMLASGRPVIATTEPDTALARAVQGCGSVVPPGNTDKFVETLEQLIDDPGRLESWGYAARERALDQWDSRRIIERFRCAMEELVRKPA